MKQYTQHFTSSTAQSQPIPETTQIRNRAGGYGFPADDWTRLDRFLILGTQEGSYYASSRELTLEAITCLDRLLEDSYESANRAVARIIEISESGRAPKNEPAIFALAYALKTAPDARIRRAVVAAVQRVCRTFTHAASFAEACQAFGRKGWGRLTKAAVAAWFEAKDNRALSYQLIKYRNRQGWTAADLLRLSHYHVADWDANRNAILGWTVGKPKGETHAIIRGFEQLQATHDAKVAARLIREEGLPWEAVPSEFAKDLEVQGALFESMPIGAMIRQLGRLTALGFFNDTRHVLTASERLLDKERLRKARIHPMAVYMAGRTYGAGQGLRGHLTWQPNQQILAALEAAFYNAFGSLRSTGKQLVIGIDFSGSMVGSPDVAGIPGFKAAEAAAIMALVTARLEPSARFVGFDTRLQEFSMHGIETITQAMARFSEMFRKLGQGTDCSIPMRYAQHIGWNDVDAFAIYTDEETWAGPIHPVEAVSQYRAQFSRAAKLISTGFVAHAYRLTPINDAGAMNVIGFDEAAPSVIQDFLSS